MTHEQRLYYWAWDTNSRVIVGPRETEDEINQLAYQTIDADFRIFCLTTANRPEAVRKIKFQLLQESKKLQESMQRFHHVKEE